MTKVFKEFYIRVFLKKDLDSVEFLGWFLLPQISRVVPHISKGLFHYIGKYFSVIMGLAITTILNLLKLELLESVDGIVRILGILIHFRRLKMLQFSLLPCMA